MLLIGIGYQAHVGAYSWDRTIRVMFDRDPLKHHRIWTFTFADRHTEYSEQQHRIENNKVDRQR
jgi:hypothetical protein